MSEWASRRKSIFLGAIVLILSGIGFIVFWNFWYQAPTCFDGVRNGGEEGVDCGGPCTLVCNQNVLQPIIRWDPRVFEILPGNWSVVVYVENPNTDADAIYVPYRFTIYSANNDILAEREAATILPKNSTVGIFEGTISIPEGKQPKRAVFELGDNIRWSKNNEPTPKITINHSPLLRLSSAPRVEANIKNESILDLENIELVITIFDGADNVIAASRTFIEELKKNEETDVFFTWPRPFKLGSKICEQPSSVVLLLDRSGSMASSASNPPEPLSSAKAAAASFVDQLGGQDRVSLISFATNASYPIDQNLSNDFNLVKEAIQSVLIEEGSTQYTNIFEALRSARQELLSPRSLEDSSKNIVLLTDGVATYPRNPEGQSEEDDIKYAESLAIGEAENAKKDTMIIYTIGLGDNINSIFLEGIASGDDRYFFAPSSQNLADIYQQISSNICEEVPARIEITYRIFGGSI